MTTELPETTEHLIRVCTTRRGTPQELRVHYGVTQSGGCASIQLFLVEDAE